MITTAYECENCGGFMIIIFDTDYCKPPRFITCDGCGDENCKIIKKGNLIS